MNGLAMVSIMDTLCIKLKLKVRDKSLKTYVYVLFLASQYITKNKIC